MGHLFVAGLQHYGGTGRFGCGAACGTLHRGVSYGLLMPFVDLNQSCAIRPPGWLDVPALSHPCLYLVFVLVSTLDVVLTWLILAMNGDELNPIAALVIRDWGLPGAIVFKFSLTLFVIVLCDVVSRSQFRGHGRARTGRFLAMLAIVVSALPVIYSLGMLALHDVRSQ